MTDAGSEATPIIGQTENDKDGKPLKTTQKTMKVRCRARSGARSNMLTLDHPQVLPEVIIYDVDLTLTLPPQMTVRYPAHEDIATQRRSSGIQETC